MEPTIHLFFKGNCLEAMTHYAEILGGEIGRVSQSPRRRSIAGAIFTGAAVRRRSVIVLPVRTGSGTASPRMPCAAAPTAPDRLLRPT